MQPLATPDTARRDPAPSRWAFRFQRLWLTPLFRALLRVGLPVFAVVFITGSFFSDVVNRETLTDRIAELRRSVAERPEFMVKLMAIDGASSELSDDIREVLPLDFPISHFDLDLAEMQKIVAGLDAVASVEMRNRPGGILQISIVERLPAVVWRSEGLQELIDAGGRRVADLPSRAARPDLPLIVGEDADRAVPEALNILTAAGPLQSRLRGLVRIGARRWDVVLDRDQRILLPESGAVAALERVIALDHAQDLLARNVVDVDMRNADRPTLRLAAPAMEALRRIKALELGDPLR